MNKGILGWPLGRQLGVLGLPPRNPYWNYPQVGEDTAQAVTPAGGVLDVSVPGTPVVGDVLLCAIRQMSATPSVVPSGWVSLAAGVSSIARYFHVAYRICDGTEATTPQTWTVQNVNTVMVTRRFSACGAPITTGGLGTGSGSPPNPPDTITGIGQAPCVWVTFNGSESPASSYDDYPEWSRTVNGGFNGIAWGWKRLLADSLNDPAYPSNQNHWAAVTICIPPLRPQASYQR